MSLGSLLISVVLEGLPSPGDILRFSQFRLHLPPKQQTISTQLPSNLQIRTNLYFGEV